jgi:ElaB/YqjD/DUF883 family membrane-anchored ribosome-binding protein
MSEQNKTNNSELVNELNKLGENLANLLKSAWDSDERRSVEREISAGLEQMSKKLNDAAEKVRTDAYVSNAKQAAKDAWQTANVPTVLEEMRKGVISTLNRINEDLSSRATPAHEASARKATEAAAETAETGGKPE